MPLVEYSLDDDGRMSVQNDTAVWYRYMDMTPQAEALFAFIEKTIDTELADELASWPTMTAPRQPFRPSWTCRTARSTYSFGSASRTMASCQPIDEPAISTF